MGFWHTGYIDFHEPTGLDPPFVPAPMIYACPSCSAVFATQEEFQKHRFEAHPYARPTLTLRGIEVGDTDVVITEALTRADVWTSNASYAIVNEANVALAELGAALASKTDCTVVVKLGNKNLSSVFRLRFEIARQEDLEGVEHIFQLMVKSRHLDVRAIEEFIERAEPFPSARRYADGICDYLYAVLAKERAEDTAIGYEAHREKFNQASQTLARYARPLGSMIRGLVAFNFNQFKEAAVLTRESRIALVAMRYVEWLDGSGRASDPNPAVVRTHIDSHLTDRDTEQVLRAGLQPIASLSRSTADLEEAVTRDASDLDRGKIRVLLAETYLASGLRSAAHRHARELRNTHAFGRWAARLTETAPRAPELP